MKNIVNICFITDTNYAVPTGVAIESLIKNCNKDTQYNLYIIAVDTDKKVADKFKKLKTNNVNIDVINTENIYDDIQTTHPHVSKVAMIKFNIPNMFPNLDKILYLDGDMLFLNDLYDLYDTNIENKYVAVVKDMLGMYDGHAKKLNHKNYFNSGMMLLNLKKMRQDNITDKLLYAKKHDKYKHFMDQDALNQVFDENVTYVSLKYNCMLQNLNYPTKDIAEFYQIKEEDIKKILENPTVLHLTNKKKPWNSDNAPGSNLWNKYYKNYQIKTEPWLSIFKRFIFNYKKYENGDYKFYIFGIKIFNCKPYFAPDSRIKGNFLFTKEYCSNDRRHLYLLGKKIFSYSKKQKKTVIKTKEISLPKFVNALYYVNRNAVAKQIEILDKSCVCNCSRQPRIIVSMTSFPARINDVVYAIYSIFNQTLKPDMIVLWLGADKFPGREKDLPEHLLQLCKFGLTIKWCEDIKAYTKLVPSLIEFPDDIIITVDDDIFYSENLIEKLYDAYKKQPTLIHCVRAHQITFNQENDEIMPYKNWKWSVSDVKPSLTNFLTGVGGVLYPPKCLDDMVTNKDLFKKLSPYNDDIWFWAMAVKKGTKINVIDFDKRLVYVDLGQELGLSGQTLHSQNVAENRNDIQIQNVIKYFKITKKNLIN